MANESKTVGQIFGSALLGITDDLIKAKESGQQLPGLLDKIAAVASDAKAKGIDIAKAAAREKLKQQTPYILLGVAVIIIIILSFK